MAITPQTIAAEIFGALTPDMIATEYDLAHAIETAIANLKSVDGDLIPAELRTAAATLLVPSLPCNADRWAMQCLEATLVGPPNMTVADVHLGESTIARIIRVREMLYDYAKAIVPVAEVS